MDKYPDMLYHYTTASGLIGIIQSGQLWATHRQFLNDSSEVSRGDHILEEHESDVRTLVKEKWPDSDRAVEIGEEWIKRVKDFHQIAGPFPWFVASLCSKPDLLTQWITYGHESGYCVGISIDGLKPASGILRSVIYKHEAQLKKLRSLAAKFLSGKIENSQFQNETPDESEFDNLITKAIGELVSFKNAAFSNENEWRIAKWADKPDQIDFRSTPRLGVIPYTTIELGKRDKSRIREIWIGPTNLGDEAERAIELLLDSQGLRENAKILKSKIPLRW
ncbi:DUF2971 domain-containing protein [Acidithrix ferrooxidans]|uniref:DUF2971 domain-containing protein n=1 Tax=Acidithrix ferrooxidans TaxID=1280514 RepID=A0A0D8HJC7_9ACTN|nr:DUF2971 domain-containing protein [Acidithrix ferrooxidans]KJF18043.1 hypothetical protein AXFE_11420 [Acidithrix ferrooxidans]